jgi:hypothetical protein
LLQSYEMRFGCSVSHLHRPLVPGNCLTSLRSHTPHAGGGEEDGTVGLRDGPGCGGAAERSRPGIEQPRCFRVGQPEQSIAAGDQIFGADVRLFALDPRSRHSFLSRRAGGLSWRRLCRLLDCGNERVAGVSLFS